MSVLQKFLFQHLPVRGAVVQLHAPWQTILARRAANTDTGPWPAPVRSLMGEMTAAATLLQSALKFDGRLILQLTGTGPLKLGVCQVHMPSLAVRSTATIDALPAQNAVDFQSLVGRDARCAITLEPAHRGPAHAPWQGIVPLTDARGQGVPNLAAALRTYMHQSEQLDTALILAANDQCAAGLLVQRMPLKGQANLGAAGAAAEIEARDALGANEDFERIATLAQSLTADELLTLDIPTILHRLFWQEQLMLIQNNENHTPHFACTCSRERVQNMLQGLGQEEIEASLAETNPIRVGCEYCGAQYDFDAVDVGQLFQAADKILPPDVGAANMAH